MSQGIKPTRKSYIKVLLGLPWRLSSRESASQCRRHRFKSLIWEDNTCYRATKLVQRATEPVLWSPGAATTEPMCRNDWSLCTRSSCSTARETTAVRDPPPPPTTGEKPLQQWRSSTAKRRLKTIFNLWATREDQNYFFKKVLLKEHKL